MSRIVPDSFRATRLKYAGRFVSGGTPQSSNPDYWDGPVQWLTPVDLGNERNDAITASKRTLTEVGAKAAGLVRLPIGSIVFSTRAPIGSVGLLACEAVTNQGCKALVPDTRELDSYFGFYLALDLAETLQSLGLGTTFTELSTYALKNVPVSLPSIDEQHHITSYLDEQTAKIDQLMEMRRRQMALLKEQRAALIQEAVTLGLNSNTSIQQKGFDWVNAPPGHWRKFKLSKLSRIGRGTFTNGPFGSDLLTSELTDSGVPVIYIRDIKATGYRRVSKVCVTLEKAKYLNTFRVDSGDIIVAKVGDPPGTASVYPSTEPSGVVTQDVIRIKPDIRFVNSEFVALWLNSHTGQAWIDQIAIISTRKRVDLESYKSLPIWLPPLTEQEEIVSFITDANTRTNRIHDAYIRQLELLTEYRAALIHECVTGQRSVPETVTA